MAGLATGGESESFKRNIANRLWRHMLGRGLVEPPDLHHSDNPSAHPELLRLLSNEFAKLNFDVKAFLREVALTDVYQRAIDLPTDIDTKIPTITAQLEQLRAQVGFQESVVQRSRAQLRESSIQLAAARRELSNTRAESSKTFAQMATVEKDRSETAAQLAKLQKEFAGKEALAVTIQIASQAAAKAAEQLKDDAELAAAAKTFDERTKKLQSQVAALEKQVGDRKATLEKHVSKRKTLEQRIPPLEKKRTDILQQIRHRSGAQLALRRQLKAEQDRHLDLTQRIAAIEQVLQYDSHQKSRLEIAARIDELSELQAKLLAQKQERIAAQRDSASKIAELKNSMQSESELQQLAEQSVDSFRAFVESVQVAAEQTELALQSLASDGDLNQARQLLSDRAQQLTSQAAQLEVSARAQGAKVIGLKKQVEGLEAQLEGEKVQLTRIEQRLTEGLVAVKELQQQQAKADALVQESRDELNDLWKQRLVVTSLKPLTPEQMALSLIHTLGLDQRYRAEAEAEWEKSNKERKEKASKENKEGEAEPTPEQREQQIVELYKKREKKVIDACVSLFASSPGSPQDVFSRDHRSGIILFE